MKSNYILIVFFLLGTALLQAQTHSDTIEYSLNTRICPGSGSYTPFLSTVNQYDRYDIKPNSLTAWGMLHKRMDDSTSYDYGFGTELDANISKLRNRFFPGELYLEGKAHAFKAFVGMKREVFGNQDQELSSGGMIWSQNSRPMPKIAFESNGYIDVPFTKGYVEVNGGISHGWFTDKTVTTHTLLHHKYAYIRVGGSFPININYGIQHVCQWSGNSATYGSNPATWDNFTRVFFGKSGDSSSASTERLNALGNHIISKNIGLDVNLKSVNISFYWQNIYEDGPILGMYEAYNKEDGLWGASVRIPKFKALSHFVLEYMSTTDQSGPWHDLDGVIYGGADNYYTNGVYPNGWSFYGMTIGNPWLTSPKYNANGSVTVSNNKVRLYYFSGVGSFYDVTYKATIACSKNWGSPGVVYATRKDQLSYQLETATPIHCVKNTNLTLGFSGDRGTMYGTNFALLLGLSISGNFSY